MEGEQEEKEAEGTRSFREPWKVQRECPGRDVQMIDSLRTFEACYKIVQVQDDMNAKAVNELGRFNLKGGTRK